MINEAFPSMPVEILGMNSSAYSGAEFMVTESEDEAKKLGYLKSEGKDYIVEDGDMIHFRYNVWNLLPSYLASRP